MSQESTPNVLPIEQQKALESQIREVAGVAREADWLHKEQDDRSHRLHNRWVDGRSNEADTRILGQGFWHTRVEHRGTLHGGTHDSRTFTHVLDNERDVNSYSDRRYGSTSTGMKVNRNGKEKVLKSDNPAVFNMLTRIALKDIREKAQADIDKTAKKAA